MNDHMYLTTTNYWAPLDDEEDEINEDEHMNTIPTKSKSTLSKEIQQTHQL